MTLNIVNAAVSIGTLVVLAATVVAAIIQLGHVRAGNELAAVLAIENDFRSGALQDALADVQHHLAGRLRDPVYRTQLSTAGYLDPRRHPEMTVCNWFETAGALAHGGFLNERLFLDSFGRLVAYYWQQLAPAIAIMRRSRGSSQYQWFEYLAARANQRGTSGGTHRYRRNAQRSPIADPWLAPPDSPQP